MPNQWYVTKDGKQKSGPWTDRQLKDQADAGQIAPSDMILKDGKGKWVRASALKNLFEAPAPVQSSLMSQPTEPQPSLLDIGNELQTRRDLPRIPRRRPIALYLSVAAIVVVAGVVWLAIFLSDYGISSIGLRSRPERIVKKYIFEKANDPKSVDFSKWGPNVSFTEKGKTIDVVRVVYRENSVFGALSRHDYLFILEGDRVHFSLPNFWGDNIDRIMEAAKKSDKAK